jgi:DNA-binding IclR family transcriptional regulator
MEGGLAMGGNARDLGRTSSSRLLALLGAFADGAPTMSLTELARASDLPVPTAHRLLGELCEWGAVERMPDGRYQIGLRLWQIGSLAPQLRNLRAIALPFMEDLYEVTHENVQLAVRDGKRVLYLDHISGRRSVGTLTKVAGRLPLHTTGVGKVILAFSEPELLESVLQDGLRRCTRYTITSPERLNEAVNHVRQTHLGFSVEEMTLGASSVAAPIFAANRALSASLAIVVRSSTDLSRLAPAVRAAALGVTRTLTGMRTPVEYPERRAAR